MKQVLLSISIIAFLSFSCKNEVKTSENLIAIIGAFDEELELLKAQMQESEIVETNNIRVIKGILNKKNVVLALSGMGKVNAAMTTTYIIHQYKPDKIIFSGIAGGLNPDLEPGDIIIGEKTVQHDLVTWTNDTLLPFKAYNPTNGEVIPLYHKANSFLFGIARKAINNVELNTIKTSGRKRTPEITVGTIACGDAFIASSIKKQELIEKFGADAVEMEGAAIAQVCRQFDVPVIIIRSISDSADEEAQTTLKGFYKTAAENSARFVMEMLTLLQ